MKGISTNIFLVIWLLLCGVPGNAMPQHTAADHIRQDIFSQDNISHSTFGTAPISVPQSKNNLLWFFENIEEEDEDDEISSHKKCLKNDYCYQLTFTHPDKIIFSLIQNRELSFSQSCHTKTSVHYLMNEVFRI